MKALVLTVAIMVLLFLVALLVFNKGKTKDFHLSYNSNVDPRLRKVSELLGEDIRGLIPDDVIEKQTKNKNLTRLLNNSGNPWNVTLFEFLMIRYILLILGIIIGLISSFVLYFVLGNILLGVIITIILPMLLYFYPTSYYENIISNRESSFKKDFPEAIDYLIMAVSGGGYSLQSAFERTVQYIPKGAVKDEFEKIVQDLRIGKTLEDALLDFSDRVPLDSIKSFSKALINANNLSVNIVDILRARAKTSRKDLELEIEKRIMNLPTKIMFILTPTSVFSILIIVLAPSIATLMKLI